MKQRTSSLPVLAVIAVIALVLGSIGTAVAAPALTKGKVKKIAAKVVAQKAPTLAVASAATAGNATNLNGLPASAYQNKVYKYTLPVQAAATNRNYTFPGLPAGNYLVNFSLLMSTAAANTVAICYLQQAPPGSTFIGVSYASYNGAFSQISGSGVVQQTATLTMNCNAASNFTITAAPIESAVTFTAIDTVTNSASVGAKGGPVSMGAASAQ